MKTICTIITLLITSVLAVALEKPAINIIPIQHASMILETSKVIIYVDPVGDFSAYATKKKPDVILITDLHGDHLDTALISKLTTKTTKVYLPKASANILGKGSVMVNGDTINVNGIEIVAMPMYNTTKERLTKHVKGVGNGYLLSVDDERIYISGDTEDIPEMRSLKAIDYAFICMNLPYTMDINQAASAVLAFTPKVVIPYHYRGKPDFSDVKQFKKIVNEQDSSIEVRLLVWYKK